MLKLAAIVQAISALQPVWLETATIITVEVKVVIPITHKKPFGMRNSSRYIYEYTIARGPLKQWRGC